ncbi:MAG: TlpA family protein disulfide reductase [Chitinophagales bacterium]
MPAFLVLFMWSTSYSQYKTLAESPMFKNGKDNYFQDTADKKIYSLAHMDSLFKTGKSPFEVITASSVGDSMLWQIRFISEMPTIRPRWIHQPFPLPELMDMNGKKVDSVALKGKIWIINCWSISCGPCIKEMPYLNRLVDSLDNLQFAFLGITFDKPDEIKDFFNSDKLKKYLGTPKPEFKFTLIADQENFLTHILGVINYPTTFIVDRTGIVKEVMEGVNLDESQNPKVYDEITLCLKGIR